MARDLKADVSIENVTEKQGKKSLKGHTKMFVKQMLRLEHGSATSRPLRQTDRLIDQPSNQPTNQPTGRPTDHITYRRT